MVIILFICTLVRYSLNYLSALPIRNNSIYTTWSINIGSFAPSYIILKYICVRNPLSFNLSPINRLIDSNLILVTPILLTLFLSNLLLSVNWLTISYSCPTITTYKSISAMLVSLLVPNFKVVTTIDSVVTSAFSSILFNFFYYNYSNNYITEPYRRYYSRFLNRLGI